MPPPGTPDGTRNSVSPASMAMPMSLSAPSPGTDLSHGEATQATAAATPITRDTTLRHAHRSERVQFVAHQFPRPGDVRAA